MKLPLDVLESLRTVLEYLEGPERGAVAGVVGK